MNRTGMAGAAISVALHGALLASVAVSVAPARRGAPRAAEAKRQAAKPIEVTFLTLPRDRRQPARKDPRSPAIARSRPAGDRSRALPRSRSRSREPTRSRRPAPSGENDPRSPRTGGGPKGAGPLLDLSPRSVARMILGTGPPSPERPGPTTAPGLLPPGQESAKASPLGDFKPSGGGSYETERETFGARIAPDGDIDFRDKGNVQMDSWVSGRFDVTDAVMHALGDDPYAYEKLKLADQTREVRLGMAQVARSRWLKASVRATRTLLSRIWGNPRLPASERRRLLFLLWDECAERGPAEVVEAGNLVRATIIGFIRKNLPAGSPDAYRPGELRRLNGSRASRQSFAPYGAGFPLSRE